MFETPVSMGRSAQSSRSDRRARPDARSKDRASALAQYSGGLEIAWSHVREPLDFDDVIEWSVTGLDGQYPIQLGLLREGVTDRERGIPLGRKPFAAIAIRDDQNVVEHRFCTVAPRASRVRPAARPWRLGSSANRTPSRSRADRARFGGGTSSHAAAPSSSHPATSPRTCSVRRAGTRRSGPKTRSATRPRALTGSRWTPREATRSGGGALNPSDPS